MNMPDFENMSPEEAMRWMESLAKRQGANTEELLTSADDVIDEVDASTVVDEPGYVPFGEKPPPKQAAPEPEPEPEPEPPAAVPASGGMPDFENMTPEESLRWMESLAKRQGANTDELLTSADDVIDEVDANTFVDEPGYTPFGEKPAPKQAAPEPEPAPQSDLDWLNDMAGEVDSELPDLSDLDALTADLEGVLDTEENDPEQANAMAWLEGLATDEQPEPTTEADLPTADDDPLAGGVDTMEWLESLARRQGVKDEELLTGGNLQLPDLPADDDSPASEYQAYDVDEEGDAAPAQQNTEDWLSGLAQPEGETTGEAPDWLSGLDDDTTKLELEYEADEEYYEEEDDDEYYEDEYADASDPAAWLGDMADDPNVRQRIGLDADPEPVQEDAPTSGDHIADMLNRGETPDAESLQAWMGNKMDELLSTPPLPIDGDEDDMSEIAASVAGADADTDPVPGEMPDWLQQMQPDPSDETQTAGAFDPFTIEPEEMPQSERFDESPVTEAFDAKMPGSFTGSDLDPSEMEAQTTGMPDFLNLDEDSLPQEATSIFNAEDSVIPEDVPDMPDWLQEDTPMGGESLADIFDTGEAEMPQAEVEEPLPPADDQLNEELVARFSPEGGDFEEDPWVQAIREEQGYNYQTDTLPQWYEERIEDPEILARFRALESALAAANLPEETELPAGQREPIPDWFNAAAAPTPAQPEVEVEVEEVASDVPAWLMEDVGEETNMGDMPDWLADVDTTDLGEGDLPAWMTEQIPEEEEVTLTPEPLAAPEQQTPPPAPQQQPTPPAPPPSSPAPTAGTEQIDVDEALATAKERVQAGEIEEAMEAYEAVIRANKQLDTVVSDVATLLKSKDHKDSAAAHRVLGDALMRQGKLQAALDTYRRALNLL